MYRVARSTLLTPAAPASAEATLVAAFDLRLERQEGVWLDRAPVGSPAHAAEHFHRLLAPAGGDSGGALYLARSGQPIGYRVGPVLPCCATGRELRDLFGAALLSGAAAAILAHRRAGGELSPCRAELAKIFRLIFAGGTLGVEILDYLLLGAEGRHRSIQDEFPELWGGGPRLLAALRRPRED